MIGCKLFQKIEILVPVIFSQVKHLHLGLASCAASASPLASLRKDTGFSISHCKNALKVNSGDINEAKKWLIKEAQSHGWAKIEKLSGRETKQGLIGIYVKNNIGTIVEVNCETDFVARNKEFQSLVANIAKSCSSSLPNQESFCKEYLSEEQLNSVKDGEGNYLRDLVALTVGKIGEKITLKRAIRITGTSDIQLKGFTHPSTTIDSVNVGKFAALTAFQNIVQDENLLKSLCVHIIGMNPSEIGSYDQKSTTEEELTSSPPKEELTSSPPKEELTSSPTEDNEETIKEEEPEKTSLLNQSFMNNVDIKVGQILQENNMQIVDFVRVQVGEQSV